MTKRTESSLHGTIVSQFSGFVISLQEKHFLSLEAENNNGIIGKNMLLKVVQLNFYRHF